MLPKCLGRQFYEKKKYPYPVKLHKAEESPSELEALINDLTKHTYFIMGNGPNYALRIGRTDMNVKEIAANVIDALPQMLAHIMFRDGIKTNKIQQISLRLTDSVDLPIFTQLTKHEILAFLTK